ncbi:NAD(P)H-dependent flavin oxidoreductase [Effusibacillus consociatus]|uniref:Probable nitronate monooxygenase n=1 Tax=Effusibacillus consociatus TaxID=1117041 RepID=A0ABV9Q5S2_9BACL
MWPKTRVTDRLEIDFPIVQAGMAGGATTPELVAAVSNAGGLGTLGAGYMSPEQIRTAVGEIRKLTDRRFAVNLFVPEPIPEVDNEIENMNGILQPFRSELGIDSTATVTKYAESFQEQLAVVIEERVPVFSFAFGIPTVEQLKALKENKITVIGTATTVREAVELEEKGIDLIVGQGSEAGGHRGTFLGSFDQALVGTMALIPQIVDHVHIPVLAAGGIMDGRGIAAALALGAEGVQMGTAFLTCSESGAHQKYKEALRESTDESTVVTRAFSGKPARGIKNRFISEMEPHRDKVPAYPIQNALTRDIRQAAAKQNRPEYMSLWAGQASRLCDTKSASELVADAADHTARVLRQFSQ